MIGDLDRRIEIYTLTEAKDAFGAAIPTDVLLCTVWASILPSSGREKVEANKPVASNEIIFGIRYRSTVTEKMKIKYLSNYYLITRIDEDVRDGRKRYMVLTAEKRF
jgi:SPP1 family predicted phage head-tail adaptor